MSLKKVFFFGILFSLFFFTQPVFAYKTLNSADSMLSNATKPTGIVQSDVKTTVGSLIQSALTVVGTVFLGLMIYGGFLWMTARGEESQIDKGKSTISAAIIGLAVVVSAYAITNVVSKNLVEKTPTTVSNTCADKYAACLSRCNDAERDDDEWRAACTLSCDNQVFENCPN